MFLLALIVIYIPKATFVIKLWLHKFRWVRGDLNPRTSDLDTNTLPPPPPGSHDWFENPGKSWVRPCFQDGRKPRSSQSLWRHLLLLCLIYVAAPSRCNVLFIKWTSNHCWKGYAISGINVFKLKIKGGSLKPINGLDYIALSAV